MSTGIYLIDGTPIVIEKNDFAGKKVSILGDSISTYEGYIPSGYATKYPTGDVDSVEKTWWYKLIQETGMILGVDNAYSGSKVGGTSYQMASLTRIQGLDDNGTPDVILFYGGTNDMLGTIGTFDSTQTYELDLTTNSWSDFATAYKDAIMRLQHYYPSSLIVAITPIWVKSTYTPAKVDSGIEVIKQICDYFGVNCLDLRTSGFTTQNLDSLMTDGVHPNTKGMIFIEQRVKKYLSSLLSPLD